ncbi:MAG TPA: serine hydrolase domain-containing protein [Actinocrinis sp.]|nr:serine hydrolase domain-containing protein [Actinocrinis sp.]HZU54576.1 serine hydrolase domain-containing protein [Actinocrinis sp.]
MSEKRESGDMTKLRELLETKVERGTLPGAVALVARGGTVEVEAAGFVDLERSAPMTRETIFRLASVSKPITAAGVMLLVDDGLIALDDPIDRWLPELAEPRVARTPDGPLDDTVPADRPITVFDLLTFRSGWGFTADWQSPVNQANFAMVRDGMIPQDYPPPEQYLAQLARIPLLSQPGEGWQYNLGSELQSVLIARVSGTPLPEFLTERLFEPLGMADTGFAVPAAKRDRFTSLYRTDPATGELSLADRPDGKWNTVPVFPSGAGGMVSTVDDWYAFGRMLLNGGAANGRQLLSAESIRLMTTDHLTAQQRAASELFLEGQGWGFGGSVDVADRDPWNVPGRYGWVGGSGTAAHIIPATGAVTILLTQASMTGPTPPAVMREFWRYAAEGE